MESNNDGFVPTGSCTATIIKKARQGLEGVTRIVVIMLKATFSLSENPTGDSDDLHGKGGRMSRQAATRRALGKPNCGLAQTLHYHTCIKSRRQSARSEIEHDIIRKLTEFRSLQCGHHHESRCRYSLPRHPPPSPIRASLVGLEPRP